MTIWVYGLYTLHNEYSIILNIYCKCIQLLILALVFALLLRIPTQDEETERGKWIIETTIKCEILNFYLFVLFLINNTKNLNFNTVLQAQKVQYKVQTLHGTSTYELRQLVCKKIVYYVLHRTVI